MLNHLDRSLALVTFSMVELAALPVIFPGGGGVWAMAGVQGKVAFGLSHFCIEVFQKKL